jgi:hypothetical protein
MFGPAQLRTFELVLVAMSTNGQWTCVQRSAGYKLYINQSNGLWHVLTEEGMRHGYEWAKPGK